MNLHQRNLLKRAAIVERRSNIRPVCRSVQRPPWLQRCINSDSEEAREQGIEDLFDLLDDLDSREDELQQEQDEQASLLRQGAQKRRQDVQDDLQVCRQTYHWLIEQGTEQVGSAKALLLAKVAELSGRYGDSEGLRQPLPPPRRQGLKNRT